MILSLYRELINIIFGGGKKQNSIIASDAFIAFLFNVLGSLSFFFLRLYHNFLSCFAIAPNCMRKLSLCPASFGVEPENVCVVSKSVNNLLIYKTKTKMKRNLLKSCLVAIGVVAGTMGAWAEDVATYYSQDYEGTDVTADWTTKTSGRFTPILQTTDGNTYLTVDQNQRYNNGTTLTNSSISLDKGTDFTMIFDMKIGCANGGAPVFCIKDYSKSSDVFTLAATAGKVTTWKINGSSSQIVNLPKTGYDQGNIVTAFTWYTFKLTRKGGDTYLTISNAETKSVVFERTKISTLSTEGGIGGMQFGTAKSYANFAIDNILVRSVVSDDVPQEVTYSITTKYQLEDGTKILDDKISYVVSGSAFTPSYDVTFDDDLYRYTYKSGADQIASVSDDAEVVVVYTREALKDWKINVNAIGDINKTLETLVVKDAKSVTANYPRYLTDNITLYMITKSRYDQGFQSTKSNITEDGEITENYTRQSSDVAFYSEAEDIPTLTSANSGNIPVRCSNGKAAYAAEDAVITKLSAGTYQIISCVFGNSGTPFTFMAGDKTIFTITTVGYVKEETSPSFTLTEPTDIVLKQSGNAGSSPKVLDYVLIRQLSAPVSVSSANYATYVTKYNVAVPADVKVYAVKANEESTGIETTEVAEGTIIPAGTGILVGATEAGDYKLTITNAAAQPLAANDLLASTGDGVTSDGATCYALGSFNGKVGFALVAENVVIPAGKAYLKVAKASGAKFISLGGEITAISDIAADAAADNAPYYTIEGIKVQKPVKGLYIHNGKKVVVK